MKGRLNMAYEINWHVKPDDPILTNPLYQAYSSTAIGAIILPQIQGDLANILASNESAPVANYLSWVIRTLKLTL
jgi:hypothetical protein